MFFLPVVKSRVLRSLRSFKTLMIIDVTDVCGFDMIGKSFGQLSSYRAAHWRPEANHASGLVGRNGVSLDDKRAACRHVSMQMPQPLLSW